MARIFAIILCLSLNACWMVGPNYHEPKQKITNHWKLPNTHVNESSNHQAKWWNLFHDPTLTCLIEQGYQNNLTLQAAAARVLQARAQLAQSVGFLYPQQQALTGNLNYNRIGGSSLQDVLPSNFYTALLGFTANWEIDFWGKYRRAILANDALFLASFAAYDQALVTLTSEIATTYIDIRTTETLIKIIKKNIQVQEQGLQIAKSRFNAGQSSLLDVEQAQTELSQTQSRLPMLRSDLQKQKDALAVLLGTTPDAIDSVINNSRGIPKPPTRVAVGIPRETLAKRPDIHQAQLEVIAQSEAIGVLKANLYPSFSLTGTFAYTSNTINGASLGDIFNWNNRYVMAGPAINWPLLNYGQITNAVRAQDARFQQAALKYQNLVLQAQQEVQDRITQFIETKKSQHFLSTGNHSAIRAMELAMIRYREGESDFTPVLDSERQQLQVQTSLTNATGDIAKALVGLYRSLGSGWEVRCESEDIVPMGMKMEMASRTHWATLLKPEQHQPAVTPWQHIKQLYLPTW